MGALKRGGTGAPQSAGDAEVALSLCSLGGAGGFLFLDADTASSVIVEALWTRLQEGAETEGPARV